MISFLSKSRSTDHNHSQQLCVSNWKMDYKKFLAPFTWSDSVVLFQCDVDLETTESERKKIGTNLPNFSVFPVLPCWMTWMKSCVRIKGTRSLLIPNLDLKLPRMWPKSMWNSWQENTADGEWHWHEEWNELMKMFLLLVLPAPCCGPWCCRCGGLQCPGRK